MHTDDNFTFLRSCLTTIAIVLGVMIGAFAQDLVLAPDGPDNVRVVFRAEKLLTVKLSANDASPDLLVNTPADAFHVERKSKSITYSQTIENNELGYSLQLAIAFELAEREYRTRTHVKVTSDVYAIKEVGLAVAEMNFPDEAAFSCYYPSGMGKQINDLRTLRKVNFNYPSDHGTMQWYTVNNGSTGIYIGTHDKNQQTKAFHISRENEGSITSAINMPVYSDEFQSPEIVCQIYPGTWHEAARYYRKWYDSQFKLVENPSWLIESPGLMLNIFKQQNGEVVYTYPELADISQMGKQTGFDLIGVWGRGVGGHDRFYPNYMPDALLGTPAMLKSGIRNVQADGSKVVTYINGKIIDTSTDYYRYKGMDAIMLDAKGKPYIEVWKKYDHISPVVFAACCPGSEEWQNKLYELAKESYLLGSDAFYVDQVSQVDPNTVQCFATHHKHTSPSEAYSTYRVDMIKNLKMHMRSLDKNYDVIITEGINDSMLPYVNMFQGVLYSIKDPNGFPELFKYTFPEVLGIVANSNPILDRYEANFNLVYGLKNEMMTRYTGDRKFLLGHPVVEQDYLNVSSPPDIPKLKQIDRLGTVTEVKQIFNFVNAHKAYFNYGQFIDDEGLSVKSLDKALIIKGYRHRENKSIGVVVWNKSTEMKHIPEISIPGYTLSHTYVPDGVTKEDEGALPPNSVELLIFNP